MDAIWTTISISKNTNISPENFWNGVKVWTDRPHIINCRIFGVHVVKNWQILPKDGQLKSDAKLIVKFLKKVEPLTATELENCLKECFHVTACEDIFEGLVGREDSKIGIKEYFVQLRCLLPKQVEKFEPESEILLIDKNNSSATFIHNSKMQLNSGISPSFPYMLICRNGRVQLDVLINPEDDSPSEKGTILWLQNKVLTKVSKWSCYIPNSPIMPSLSEVSLNSYNENYHHLKSKYGKKLVEMWPECTDPLKFVYEDIGIAAYLLTLWEQERLQLNTANKQNFVDLGCGNGLLVHILASEGHKGVGVDIRKRAIWELYGPETHLIEKVFTPSEDMLFPEYDWIIGNHSDELTPWIPVIAARSSYKMRVFLLPCCCYTFNGKYQRSHGNVSNYQSYIEFLKELCTKMGFNVKQDKLRIPSTRRICFTCMSRNYQPESEAMVDKERIQFIELHSKKLNAQCASIASPSPKKLPKLSLCCKTNSEDSNSENMVAEKWESSFKPRDKKEMVQNCTALDRTFLNGMVLQIFRILLDLSDDFVTLKIDEKDVAWKVGGQLRIEELAEKLNQNDLLQLKNQNGGLQTLLRNRKNIFSVIKGKVCISTCSESSCQPAVSKRRGRRPKIKINKTSPKDPSHCKPCFFHCHHPQGCPLPPGACRYAHLLP